jgi:hypothetical protein
MGKGLPFGAPCSNTFVVIVGRSAEIRRRVRGIDPLSKVLARLVSYTRGQAFVIGGDQVGILRTV